LKKMSDYLLYIVVGANSAIFIIVLIVYIVTKKENNEDLERICISFELMWALIDTIVCLSLVGIGFFTVYKLSQVFGDHFNKEALYVSVISVVFCIGYLVHGIYDWVLYYMFHKGLLKNKITKIWAEMTWLGIIWTQLPVLTIYLMHRKNFKSFKSESLNEIENNPELEKRASQGLTPSATDRFSETEYFVES